MDRSAAARSTTGFANVTVTGMPTPTTSPAAGETFATADRRWHCGHAVARRPGQQHRRRSRYCQHVPQRFTQVSILRLGSLSTC